MKDLIEFLNEIENMRVTDRITDSLYRSCVKRELDGSDLDKDYILMLEEKYLGSYNKENKYV